MVMLDEEAEDREVLVLAIDRWTQTRMIRQLMRFDLLAGKLERAALTEPVRKVFVEIRALGITLQTWLREAVPPAGFTEVGENEEK